MRPGTREGQPCQNEYSGVIVKKQNLGGGRMGHKES